MDLVLCHLKLMFVLLFLSHCFSKEASSACDGMLMDHENLQIVWMPQRQMELNNLFFSFLLFSLSLFLSVFLSHTDTQYFMYLWLPAPCLVTLCNQEDVSKSCTGTSLFRIMVT